MANSDYGAIPLTLAESTSEALNTKLGVTTGFKPSEWPAAIASIPTGGAGVITSLKNNYLMSDSGSKEYQSPIDANNYVEVSGDTVTLHRNKSDYHLYIYTPLLTAGHLYTMSFESVSGTDGKFYVRTTDDITTNPVIVTQVAQINDNSGLSITFIPQTDCYYGICLWRSEYNDISVTNPQLVDYSAESGGGTNWVSVLSQGQISYASGSYSTVSFSDISNDKYLYVKVYVTIDGTDYSDIIGFPISKIPANGGYGFIVELHTTVYLSITRTSISCTNYGGNWYNIYADIVATDAELFT